MESELRIRPAEAPDAQAIVDIVVPIVREGSTYALDRAMSAAEVQAYWLGPDKRTFVAEVDGAIVGTYYLKTNQAGGGSHVCNCGYITALAASGKGVARAMGAHSLVEARASGYRAMQFNFVVSTNARAIKLWQSLGFAVVGTLPGAFNHPRDGYVDALVMYRDLKD